MVVELKKKKLSIAGQIGMFIILLLFIIVLLVWQNIKNIHYEEVNEIEETPNYVLKIDYPIVDNKRINKEIKKYIEDKRREFILAVDGLDTIMNEPYDFKVNYEMNTFQNINTIHIIIYSYTGGNHYMRDDNVFRYNIDTGENIDINYFLEETGLEDLSKIAYQYVLNYFDDNNEALNEEWIKEGTEAISENYRFFEFRNNGLAIRFIPYQVGPWSMGEINILIPYKELKKIVKPEFLNIENDDVPVVAENPNQRDLSQFKDKKLIAFTFDDGPSGASTKKLLDNLDKYNARVTFFCLGSRVGNFKENVKRAYEMGNTIGSHTYNHLNLFKLDEEGIKKEITDTNIAIETIIGTKPIYIRPPYGNTNNDIKTTSGMYTILWNIDPEDWKVKNADKIADRIVDKARDGSIVLLHDIYMTSVEGALKAMEILEHDGYAFVTIDEMAKIKGINLEILKSYYSF